MGDVLCTLTKASDLGVCFEISSPSMTYIDSIWELSPEDVVELTQVGIVKFWMTKNNMTSKAWDSYNKCLAEAGRCQGSNKNGKQCGNVVGYAGNPYDLTFRGFRLGVTDRCYHHMEILEEENPLTPVGS
jgi:hypothetical protein